MLEPLWSDGLLEAGMGDETAARLLGWPARVAHMIEVEAALGNALAVAGLISDDAAQAIGRACDVERIDLEELARASATAPTPVIPLVRALTADAEPLAAAHLHHGATSQDVIDTATVLQVRSALEHLEGLLLTVADRCAELAVEHEATVVAGRTLGQHAVPVTLGLRTARWLGALDRRIQQVRWVRTRTLTLQLGGAAGTLGAYGVDGLTVARAMADDLGLPVPDLPWHAERDRIVELVGALTPIVTTVMSIAQDLVLLSQPELAEVAERPSGPGSSAMPHKRNPVHATAARAAGHLALGELATLERTASEQELERAAGGWQAEWVALPSALVRTCGAVRRLSDALDHLEVDAGRARHNLEELGLTASEALSAALGPALGRQGAQALVSDLAATVVADHRPLGEVARADTRVTENLDDGELEHLLDPATSLQLVGELVGRALKTHREVRGERGPA